MCDIPHELGSTFVAPTRLTENSPDTPDGHSEMLSTRVGSLNRSKKCSMLFVSVISEVIIHGLCGDVLEFNFKRFSDGADIPNL